MNHPHLSQELSQPISENLQKLAALFPAVVKDGALDIEALREELGEFEEINPGDEKYELNWVGKQAAKKEAFKPLLGKTLAFKPEDSKHPETTQNLYIEGDNLEALKLLRQNYYGEVKMIYIDPPYNTGNDFVYTDKFAKSGDESEEEEGAVSDTGKRLIKNEKSSNRFHARWLDMMYPTLRISKEILQEDGAIFISIGDDEISNLQKICCEVFGESNQVAIAPRIAKRTSNKGTHFRPTKDYVLVFAKNISLLPEFGILKSPDPADYTLSELNGRKYKQSGASLYQPSLDSRPNQRYYIEAPDGSLIIPPGNVFPEEKIDASKVRPLTNADKVWRWSVDTYLKQKDLLIFTAGSDRNPLLDENGNQSKWNIYPKVYLDDDQGASLHPEDVIYDYPNSKGTKEINSLSIPFSFSKPSALLGYLIKLLNVADGVVLDFFSGSASTAHAVMELNAEDGGKRRHIMVQLPEVCDEESEAAKAGYKTIAEIGRERIRRAGEKVKEDLHAKAATASEEEKAANLYLTDPDSLDIGFKAFRIEDTKINWIRKDLKGEEISFQGMGNQDALDFVLGFTDEDIVYEVMLRQSNIPLTQAITKPVPGANGKRTYLYGESYLVCLEETVTKELIETLAALEPTPLKYFFRDSAFGKDIALKDETFRRLNAEIAKNHGAQGTAYTVEFI